MAAGALFLAALRGAVKSLIGRPAAPAAPAAPAKDADGPKTEEPVLPAAGSSLYRLLYRMNNRPEPAEGEGYRLSELMEDGKPPGKGQAECLARLEREAEQWMREAESDEPVPMPARAMIFVMADKMSAWAFVLPPLFDGPPLDPMTLARQLAGKGIVYGVDDEKVRRICGGRQWMALTRVAAGLPAQNGEDGRVADHFSREFEIRLQLRDDGTMDYKDLGWLQVVSAGDALCDIVPPTAAVAGSNVLGVALKGRDGAKAKVPRGQNTAVSEDGLALVAAIDGVVSFVSGCFRVDPLLIIKGDVDIAVGSLDVVGDVLVYGDVLEGFEVKATGNVTVQGMVEGALVEAGGDIQVGAGMNGSTAGFMKAGGEVRCKFIENANVEAGGRVTCDNIINSVVSSDGDIEVKTGRGAIIGGKISARRYIHAKTVGNRSNRGIAVALGNSAEWLRQKRELEAKVAHAREVVEDVQKDIRYLTGGGRRPKAGAGSLLADMKLSHSVQQMQLAKLERMLEEINGQEVNNAECRLRAEVVYPPAQVAIGDEVTTLRETYYNAMIYLKDGQVHVANV